jgi:hypothetical protein
MTDDLSPAGYAQAIHETRERLLAFVRECPTRMALSACHRRSACIGVIADHVAHSCGYLSGWIGDIAVSKDVAVTTELVDDLNADHADRAVDVTPLEVAGHLRSSGDALIAGRRARTRSPRSWTRADPQARDCRREAR